jgi:hypothetical protein
MLTQEALVTFSPTSLDELRRPHPEQKRIDADSASLLRATALDVFRRLPSAQIAPSGSSRDARVTR